MRIFLWTYQQEHDYASERMPQGFCLSFADAKRAAEADFNKVKGDYEGNPADMAWHDEDDGLLVASYHGPVDTDDLPAYEIFSVEQTKLGDVK